MRYTKSIRVCVCVCVCLNYTTFLYIIWISKPVCFTAILEFTERPFSLAMEIMLWFSSSFWLYVKAFVATCVCACWHFHVFSCVCVSGRYDQPRLEERPLFDRNATGGSEPSFPAPLMSAPPVCIGELNSQYSVYSFCGLWPNGATFTFSSHPNRICQKNEYNNGT